MLMVINVWNGNNIFLRMLVVLKVINYWSMSTSRAVVMSIIPKSDLITILNQKFLALENDSGIIGTSQ